MITIQQFKLLEDIESSLPFPEQRRSFNIMLSHLLEWDRFHKETFTLNDLIIKDNKFFTYSSLNTADLPKGDIWQWNQSRSKTRKTISDELKLCFCKLNTRKKKGVSTKSPPYKLWIFQLYFTKLDNSCLSFAWCEKGEIKPLSSCNTFTKTSSSSSSSCNYVHSSNANNYFNNNFNDLINFEEDLLTSLSSPESYSTDSYSSSPSLSSDVFSCNQSSNNSSSPTIEITLQDLSFLRDFTDYATAKSFGWI